MKKSLKIIKSVIFIMVQLAALITAFGLQYFSDKKMGVMRYIEFQKRQYEITWFTPRLITIYMIVLILGILFDIITLFFSKGEARKKIKKYGIYAIVANLTGLIYMATIKEEQVNAYHFFLIAILIIIILQNARLILKFIKNFSGKKAAE